MSSMWLAGGRGEQQCYLYELYSPKYSNKQTVQITYVTKSGSNQSKIHACLFCKKYVLPEEDPSGSKRCKMKFCAFKECSSCLFINIYTLYTIQYLARETSLVVQGLDACCRYSIVTVDNTQLPAHAVVYQ